MFDGRLAFSRPRLCQLAPVPGLADVIGTTIYTEESESQVFKWNKEILSSPVDLHIRLDLVIVKARPVYILTVLTRLTADVGTVQ